MSIQPDQKTDLLFKQFTGVANIFHDPTDFSVQPKAFTPGIINKSIYSRDIPNNIAGITAVNGFGITVYGTQALDLSYGDASANIGLALDLGNNLRYYHRLPLDKVQSSDQAYHKLDASGNNILQDTIPFKYDAEFDSYFQSLYIYDSATNIFQFQTLGGGVYKWLLDYQSGYVQFYGDPTNIILSPTQKPCISFVKYTGPKGAGGGSIGGGDISYNNLIIDSSLIAQDGIFENLTVNQTALLPEETLIHPRFDKLSGTHITNHPFFDPEYPVTKQYDAFNINYTKNPVTENDWITIARCGEVQPSNADGRADALFKVTHASSGRHETITFIATEKYGRGFAINVLQHDWYSGPNFKALRIAYNSTYQGGVVQLQFTSNLTTTDFNHPLAINIVHNYDYPGWELYTDTSGSRIADGREVFYVIPDNNPQSQNTNVSGLTYPLNNEFKLENLDWDPNAGTLGGANQMTTNPSRFTRQVDVVGNLTLKDINVLNKSDITFYNNATTNDIEPFVSDISLAGSTPAGYYLIAEVDDLLDIYDAAHPDGGTKPNFSQLLAAGNFRFLARPNLDDQGYNSGNRLDYKMETLIGINQHYQNALFNDEIFHNTKYCIAQSGTPFKSLHIFRDSTALKYKLYIYVGDFGNKNKLIDFSVILTDNGENVNPIPTNIDKDLSLVLNWDLTNITRVASPPGTELFTLLFNKSGFLKWGGTNLPYLGDDVVTTFGNTILQKWVYDSSNKFDNDDKQVASLSVYDSGGNPNLLKQATANATIRLLAKHQPNGVGTTPLYTHEIVANFGVQNTGTSGATNESTFLNILSNNYTHSGNHLINNILLQGQTGGAFFYNVHIERNTALTSDFELEIQLYNNDKNSFNVATDKGIAWQIGNGLSSSGYAPSNIRKIVDTSVTNFSAYNNDALLANKFGTGGGDGGGCLITEDTDIIDSSIQTNISADGNNNLINKLYDGAMVIDAKTPDSTGGGLKIFNSGGTYNTTLAYPKISLIPFINSGGAGTLGNPTTISVNDDESTTFQGSGNFGLFTGQKNFGNFNLYQGDGTTLAASNVIHSEHSNGTEYQLSLNHSRNDTDVIINTPSYNILDAPNEPAMVADSGTDTITFNAPTNINNNAVFNNPVEFNDSVLIQGEKPSLYEEHVFNTNAVTQNTWITLAQTGDGSDRNQLRSDGLFILEDRLGSHHQTIIFRAGAKFNSGIYINVIINTWFSTARFKDLRIAYDGTYDGSVLQVQVNTQNTSNVTLRVYHDKNNQGWFVPSSLTGSPAGNNNPTVYVVTGSSNGFGHVYTGFRTAGNILYDPNGRNSTSATSTDAYFEQGDIFVNGGNLTVNGGAFEANGTYLLDGTGDIHGVGTIDDVDLIDGLNAAGGSTIIRANNSGIGSNSAYLDVDSPITMPNANGSLCWSSLNNAGSATYVYNSDNNTLMYKTDSSNHPQTTNYVANCMSCPVTLWNWTENYLSFISPNTTTASWVASYNKTGIFSPFQFGPASNNPPGAGGSDVPLVYDTYKAPHAGFLTALTWKWVYYSAGAIQIRRSYGFGNNAGSSRLRVRMQVTNPGGSSTLFYNVGDMLVGPGPGGALGTVTVSSTTADAYMNFTVNPRTTLIPFEKDALINFNLFFSNSSLFADDILVNIPFASTSNTTVAAVMPYFHFYVES